MTIQPNCLPHGATLVGYLLEQSAEALEVRACRLIEMEGGDEHISSDACADDVALFSIYARSESGELVCLHDMPDLEEGQSIEAAQAEAVAASQMIAAQSGLCLPTVLNAHL